jgi:hypothetical protein
LQDLFAIVRANVAADPQHTVPNAPDSARRSDRPIAWSVEDSAELYQVNAWGKGYFCVNPAGHLVVRPDMNPEREIDAIQFDPFHSPWAPVASQTLQTHALPTPAEAAAAEPTPTAPAPTAPSAQTSDFRAAVADYERTLLQNALAANRFNQRATATALNLSYDQLRHALKRHKLLETDAA